MIALINSKKKVSSRKVYQFKISLKYITPLIWRRIQVPENYSFWDFHVAIQDAMGWKDCHLHAFNLISPKTGKEVRIEIPADTFIEEGDEVGLAGWDEYIADYFPLTNTKARYEYDFGDSWLHDIEFEGIFPKVSKQHYPLCMAGERTCPPEDCGSYPGYEELVKAMKNPKHPRRRELIEWLGYKYDPDAFKPSDVVFDNPKKRLEIMGI